MKLVQSCAPTVVGVTRRGLVTTAAAKSAPSRYSGGYAAVEKGKPLQPWGHRLPEQLPVDAIDIKVTHNGLCHTDIHMRDNDWGISKYPFIPGHEVVGEVLDVGSQVHGLRPGQRVGVGWIGNSCRRCAACLRGEENLCEPGYTGLIVNGGHGGFQASMRVPADFAYAIPDGLDSAAAAPLLCAGITVYVPLKRYLRAGGRVAVVGIGGLGHLALQFAAAMGGIVTAISGSPDKEAEARHMGASHFMSMSPEDVERHKSHFDLIINCATVTLNTGKLLSLLRNDGTLVQVGIPGGGATMTLPLQDVVFNQKRVAGSIVGGRADMQAMLELAAAKKIAPLVEVMPSYKINEAFEHVAANKARYRVVLDFTVQDPAVTQQEEEQEAPAAEAVAAGAHNNRAEVAASSA